MTPAPQGPLISVILPTHNRAPLLRRAIRSVLAQTYRNLELIVVDDASTDDSETVVRSVGDPRVRYLRHDRNRRAAAARNTGIAAARGALIAFQDDDDIWLMEKLQKQVHRLAESGSGSGLCLCAHYRWTSDGVELKGTAQPPLDFRRGPRSGFSGVITPAWLVRRDALERTGGFDERLKTWDDWELAARLSRICQITTVLEPLLIQDRVLGGQMWRNTAVYAHDMHIILEKHMGLWRESPRQLALQYFTLGKYQMLHESAGDGRRSLLAAIRTSPTYSRGWAALIFSAFGSRGFRWLDRMTGKLKRRGA